MRVEIRNQALKISGYVNAVGRDSREMRDAYGPFVEQIAPGAFAEALKAGNTVELRYNHRRRLDSTDGGLRLAEDAIGLRAECEVRDAEVFKAAEAGKLRGWSFGFVCTDAKWETRADGKRHRTVTGLDLLEVSILDVTPAYIATSIETRDDGDRLCEYRIEDAAADVIRTVERKEEEVITEQDDRGEVQTEIARHVLEVFKMKRRE